MSKAFKSSSARIRAASKLPVGPRLVYFVLAILPWVWIPRPGQAQVAATISGRVTDAAGVVVDGAAVTVKSIETGATRVVKTDEAGNFKVLSLLRRSLAVATRTSPGALLGRRRTPQACVACGVLLFVNYRVGAFVRVPERFGIHPDS